MYKFPIFLSLCLFISACSSDVEAVLEETETPSSVTFTNVDEELWPFFASFEAEAAKRNIKYDLNALQISGTIVALHQGSVAGVCSYSSNQPNSLQIDADFWNMASDLYKEMIVFHELGHCVINRGHYESTDNNGNCISIMRSGLSGCRDNYMSVTRDDYLDELFFNRVNLL